jgi:IMP dehydrogenase
MKNIPLAYSLDDVLLRPRFSKIKSRLDTDIFMPLTQHYSLAVPIVATNMSTITEYEMAKTMARLGGAGMIHRFLSIPAEEEIVRKLKWDNISPIIASIGILDEDRERAHSLVDAGVNILLIDIAHAHSEQTIEQLKYIKGKHNVDVIVGNVATGTAVEDLIAAGADAIRVGIGGGSRCTTRTVTGHGIPNLTSLLEAVEARNAYFDATKIYIPIIIDGGIKNSGDIVKALYFGADVASLGYLLAGTDETPGELVKNGDGIFKKYYGMASKEAQAEKGSIKKGIAPEGFSELVPYQGPVESIIENLVGGIRSGLSYSGANDIKRLREIGEPILLTSAGQAESKIN